MDDIEPILRLLLEDPEYQEITISEKTPIAENVDAVDFKIINSVSRVLQALGHCSKYCSPYDGSIVYIVKESVFNKTRSLCVKVDSTGMQKTLTLNSVYRHSKSGELYAVDGASIDTKTGTVLVQYSANKTQAYKLTWSQSMDAFLDKFTLTPWRL